MCGNSFKTAGKAFLMKLVERTQSCHQGKRWLRFSLLILAVLPIILTWSFTKYGCLLYTTPTLSQTTDWLKRIKKERHSKAHLLIEMNSGWLSHEAGWEIIKSVQRCHQRKRVATLTNLKYQIYFNLLNTFCFHMCYFIVLMSSLLFYNVENSKHEEKPWNE